MFLCTRTHLSRLCSLSIYIFEAFYSKIFIDSFILGSYVLLSDSRRVKMLKEIPLPGYEFSLNLLPRVKTETESHEKGK